MQFYINDPIVEMLPSCFFISLYKMNLVIFLSKKLSAMPCGKQLSVFEKKKDYHAKEWLNQQEMASQALKDCG